MNTKVSDNTPVIIGVGQVTEAAIPSTGSCSSAYDLAAVAGRRAIENARSKQAIGPHIDALTCIRLFEDSTRDIAMVTNPLGASNNVPGSIARRLDISPRTLIYAAVGGQTPQRLVNEFCERIYRGENRCALITGAEAIANIKFAVRNGLELDWNESVDGDYEDRWLPGDTDNMVSSYEMAHGVFLPVQTYPLFENAYRYTLGAGVEAHRRNMAKLFAPFSEVAARNPYAQFRHAYSEDFLATPSAENYLLSEPYTKWFVAQDAVNQGAAVLLASVGLARELGVPEANWVYLHAYADADDHNVVERPALSTSAAQKIACEHALNAAGKKIDDIHHLDIYSCFPIAVTSACAALGISSASRPLTLTGGLPFFGGPGNNYSMHAIAEVVEKVRNPSSSWGMVIANGGYLSKHSAGIYSTETPSTWRPIDSSSLKQTMRSAPRAKLIEKFSGNAIIETYVAAYKRSQADSAYVFARTTDSDARVIAKVKQGDAGTLMPLFRHEPIGRRIYILPGDGVNYFSFAE